MTRKRLIRSKTNQPANQPTDKANVILFIISPNNFNLATGSKSFNSSVYYSHHRAET